jgi:hypothetical protein
MTFFAPDGKFSLHLNKLKKMMKNFFLSFTNTHKFLGNFDFFTQKIVICGKTKNVVL